MKKAEMEAHHAEYLARMAKALTAEHSGLYRAAVEAALSAWDHIDGMMQYVHKYEKKDFASISAIEMIFTYAPMLLDFQSLDKLEALLNNNRRIERNASDNLEEKLTQARARMWDNHRLLIYLEMRADTKQDELRQVLGRDQVYWRTLAEAWEHMELLRRTPNAGSYLLNLSTRMDELISAKCPSCGTEAEAPKAMFLETMTCPDCRANVLFVLLPMKSC